MRLWIAAFLISLFAFQALPLTALGKSCLKAKIAAGEAAGEDSGDDEGAVPEAGKLKKEAPSAEDYYLHPAAHRMGSYRLDIIKAAGFPERPIAAAAGHARLHTRPPDRH